MTSDLELILDVAEMWCEDAIDSARGAIESDTEFEAEIAKIREVETAIDRVRSQVLEREGS